MAPRKPSPSESVAPVLVDTAALHAEVAKRAHAEDQQRPGYRRGRRALALVAAVFAVTMGVGFVMVLIKAVDGRMDVWSAFKASALIGGLGVMGAALSRQWWKGHAPLGAREREAPALARPQPALASTQAARAHRAPQNTDIGLSDER